MELSQRMTRYQHPACIPMSITVNQWFVVLGYSYPNLRSDLSFYIINVNRIFGKLELLETQ